MHTWSRITQQHAESHAAPAAGGVQSAENQREDEYLGIVYLYTYVYVCVYTLYTCVHICMVLGWLRSSARMGTLISLSYTCIHMYMYVYSVFVCLYVCTMHIYICACTYIHGVRLYMCVYVYTWCEIGWEAAREWVSWYYPYVLYLCICIYVIVYVTYMCARIFSGRSAEEQREDEFQREDEYYSYMSYIRICVIVCVYIHMCINIWCKVGRGVAREWVPWYYPSVLYLCVCICVNVYVYVYMCA